MPDILDFTGTSIDPEPWNRILFRSGTVGVSILFGLAFLVMAQRVRPIRDHLTVAAMGVMIISIGFSVSNLQQTFGIAAHSLVLLSSYLFAIGLYSSAISISHDATLRHDIKNSIKKSASSDWLDGAGRAQMEQEMESRVIKIAKNSNALLEQSGVPPSLQEEDLRIYMRQVLSDTLSRTFGDNKRRGHTDSDAATA